MIEMTKRYKSFNLLLLLTLLGLVPAIVCAQDFLNLNTQITIEGADRINSKHLEFAPAYYGSGLVFVHAKQDKQQVDQRLGMSYFELMYAELGPDGKPGRARDFSPNIRTRFHEGPVAFSNDLKQIYFTRTNISNGQNVLGADARTSMKIYIADKGADDWENVRQLPFCSDDYSVMSPTLSPDNMELIFMSDMPGGFGGMDLYISDKYAGVWSTPVNLGPVINTSKNEALPYWHENNVLFFASDGHPGKGKLDIFGSFRGEDGTFSSPVNLGPNFNTRRDDLTFICDQEGKTGFFASSRKESLGKDDIYFFRSDESIFATWLAEPALATMTLYTRDRISLAPVPYTSVWIFPIGPEGPEGLVQVFDSVRVDSQTTRLQLRPEQDPSVIPYVTDGLGAFPAALNPARDYLIVLQATGYEQRVTRLQQRSIATGNEYHLDMDSEDKSIGRPSGSGDCIVTSAVVIANSSYKPLSDVVVQLRNSCNGSSQLIETDFEGRFRVCLNPACNYDVKLVKEGFLDETYTYTPVVNAEEKVIYLTESDLERRKNTSPAAGDVLILDHLYYDFNKSAIRTGEAHELISLAEMMIKYPDMTIELESHTDSRGTPEYNYDLSEQRGISAKELLESRGVLGERIQLKPMGESRLRNGCTDGVPCSEQEHQQNRRTEIRILSVDPNLEIRYRDQ
jgi:outer membrane protein OmpA-like peptidoglycan-associated protein